MNNDVIIDIIVDDGMERIGILSVSVPNRPDLGGVFSCNTLELPYKDNKPNISAIPVGKYPCEWTRSNRLSKLKGYDFYTYQVMNVPNREGIRIHSANYAHELLGCIALGDELVDIDHDGNLDVTASKKTINIFETLMNKEPFNLIINAR